MRLMLVLASTGCLVAVPAAAQTSPEEAADDGFALGRITVVGTRTQGLDVAGATLSSETMLRFNRTALDQAVALIPGVSSTNAAGELGGGGGGTRNERTIFIRGFGRYQAPLSVDGVRVFLPADNRIDYARFLTPDLAEIQVSKGYASVLDGPGAMGGAINLVTRRPTEELQAEGMATWQIDGDGGSAGYTAFGFVGTKQGRWYAQASYARQDLDSWSLSDDFVPTATEDGGARDFSGTEDWRANVKLGFTPNATDEYALSFTRQEGSKNAPLHVQMHTLPNNQRRFWSWPYWNLDSVTLASRTELTPAVRLETRAYYNAFENLLSSFNDRTQTAQTQGFTFNSYYDDAAYGGLARLAVDLAKTDTLTFAVHYRNDQHTEYQIAPPVGSDQPRTTDEEETFSVALENRAELLPSLTFTAGVSYDTRVLKQAQTFNASPPCQPTGGGFCLFETTDGEGVNGQLRLDWMASAATDLYAFVSSRSRFPTLFERYSFRFGSSLPNPRLGQEEATNYEVGGSHRFGDWRVEGAVFYSDLSSAIFNVQVSPGVTQTRNVGDGEYYGAEIGVTGHLTDSLLVGGNYTRIERDLSDPSNPAFRPTGLPENQAFAFLEWRRWAALAITPSIDYTSDRWAVTAAAPTTYYETGEHLLLNLAADFDLTDKVSIGAGGRNLADENFMLSDGFPEPGRSFFVRVQARY